MKTRTKVILFLALSGTVAAGGVAAYSYIVAPAKREAEIARANADALLDTIARYQADSTETVTLMASQDSIAQDSIAKVLASLGLAIDGRQQALRSLQTLRVEFSRLRREFESVAIEEHTGELEEGEHQAEFNVDGPPVEGTLRVVYRPADPWSLFTDLGVTPFSQTYNVGCDELKRAIVNVTSPEWVHVTLERGTVDPNLCNPPTRGPLLEFNFGKAVWGIAGVAVGAGLYYILDHVFDGESSSYYPNHDAR